MGLGNFPLELLAEIFSLDGPLIRQDIKSVRLTCRKFCKVATPILFYCIQISPLFQDQKAFFKIAESDLSCFVRVIVWNELGGDLSAFKLKTARDNIGENEQRFLETLMADAETLFWLKVWNPDPYRPTTLDFPEDHTISRAGYPMTVEAIRTFINNSERKCVYNLGFTAFLVPTLKALAKAPQPKVTRLLYADEGYKTRTALTRLKVEDTEAFSTLQHLDLCISGPRVEPIDLKGFLACLGNARKLTNLQLCQEKRWQFSPFIINLLSQIPTLPCLTEVYLKEVLSPSALKKFIGRHAATLKGVKVIPRYDQEDDDDDEDYDDADDDEGGGGPGGINVLTALDYSNISFDQETTGKSGINDDEGVPDVDMDTDMRPFQSEDAQNLRTKNAPLWDWGRDEDGGVWYWQVPDTAGYITDGHETEVWYFEHNRGHAYGQDPLEFWADWDDGPDSEDKATPTPYGWGLLHFVQQKGEVGSRIPFEDTEYKVMEVVRDARRPNVFLRI
ncbi:hypothetical protein NW762_001491 [Fusarium torreyae]|uniref:F-box domain-containing protein n=1 Tax=Fusarium torreyae TaxID=1237075 RepID=A0A9W8SFS3_9HYPO|nr:hypothetical protein NW762_001491 [Fusarium torreyae]